MIVDTSALVAILFGEADAERFAIAISRALEVRISAATYVELGAVIDRGADPVASRRVDELLGAARITIEPVTEVQARIARQAFRDFGKGSGHAAALNFGDCFAYALSRDRGEPLLFKGEDFNRTDVTVA